jgi:hypothetical protein
VTVPVKAIDIGGLGVDMIFPVTTKRDPDQDEYTEQETQRRVEAALRGSRIAGYKPQSELKLGKPRGKRAKSPGKRKAVKK